MVDNKISYRIILKINGGNNIKIIINIQITIIKIIIKVIIIMVVKNRINNIY